MMKIIEAVREIEKIEQGIEKYPYNVWTTFFHKADAPSIAGSGQISLTSDTDYKSIEEVREAITYMVEQFGGKVKWK